MKKRSFLMLETVMALTLLTLCLLPLLKTHFSIHKEKIRRVHHLSAGRLQRLYHCEMKEFLMHEEHWPFETMLLGVKGELPSGTRFHLSIDGKPSKRHAPQREIVKIQCTLFPPKMSPFTTYYCIERRG